MLRKLLRSRGACLIYFCVAAYAAFLAWMQISAPSRLDERALQDALKKGTTTVRVVLPFDVEEFHVDKLQPFGRVGGFDGNAIVVRGVSTKNLERLTHEFFWIRRVEWSPPEG